MENTQEEQNWALGTLTIFVILLIISGISDFVEVGIGVCTFLFSWLAVSYSIRNFGKGGTSKKELKKEMQIFSVILLVVLVLITLLFNYFCTLGYVNIVGGVVFVLILYRIYKVFYKNY